MRFSDLIVHSADGEWNRHLTRQLDKASKKVEETGGDAVLTVKFKISKQQGSKSRPDGASITMTSTCKMPEHGVPTQSMWFQQGRLVVTDPRQMSLHGLAPITPIYGDNDIDDDDKKH